MRADFPPRTASIAAAFAAALWMSACAEREPPPAAVEPAGQAAVVAPPAGERVDPDSGLIVDEHWELVRAHCGACHSPQLVIQNRGSRQTWLDMIRWMQETQGLWAFDEVTETAILDYLEKNYAPGSAFRRAPLGRALMPENPYAPDGG